MSSSTPEQIFLRPTAYSPNNPLPVHIYRNVLPEPVTEQSTTEFLESHAWEKRGTWGHIPTRHFHPNSHECYGIFAGHSTLKLGQGLHDEQNLGIEISLRTGDVIVLPAGTTHCCLESSPEYRYIGVYPKDSPRWRNEFGKEPIDLGRFRQETAGVGMPEQDPVYGIDGPLIVAWRGVDQSVLGV